VRTKIPLLIFAAVLSSCGRQEDSALSGADLYANYCSACHGPVGEGDGPVAAVMQINVPNLRSLSARAGGRFPRDDVTAFIDGRSLPVSHGDRRMPIWGNVFGWDETGDDAVAERIAQSRIAAIVDFLSEIQYE